MSSSDRVRSSRRGRSLIKQNDLPAFAKISTNPRFVSSKSIDQAKTRCVYSIEPGCIARWPLHPTRNWLASLSNSVVLDKRASPMRNRASSLRRHFAAFVCVSFAVLTGFSSSVSAAVQKSPALFSASSSSTRAIALESISMVSEPFALNMETSFSASDPQTRITLFGTDFEFLQGEGFNALSASAQDGAGAVYSLKVEYVGAVQDFAGVYMVILRLNDTMTGNLGDVLVNVNLHGMSSNRVRVAIGHLPSAPCPGTAGADCPADDSAPNPAPTTPPGAPSQLTLAQYQAQFSDPSFPGDADIIRFLEQSSWGPRAGRSDFNRVRQIGMEAYLNEQFNEPVANVPKRSD